MSIIEDIIYKLQAVVDITLTTSIVAIGLFTVLIDSKSLKSKKLKKEAKFAKALGIIYIIGGPLLYVILKLI